MSAPEPKVDKVYKMSPAIGVAFVFLLLLFAFILGLFLLLSIGFAADGLWIVAVVSALVTLVILAVFAFFFVLVLAAFKTRIVLDAEGVEFVLPTWRGPTPFPPFHRGKIAYGDIASVEMREEISTTLGFPFHSTAASLVTREGRRIVIGYVQDYTRTAMPYLEIAQAIAARAKLNVVAKGAVKAGDNIAAMARQPSAWDERAQAVSEEEAARSRTRASRWWKLMWIAVAIYILFQLWADLG